MKHMKNDRIITDERRQRTTEAIMAFQCRLFPALEDLSSQTEDERDRQAAKTALSQIADMRRILDELQKTIMTGCVNTGTLSIRQMAKLLDISPATAARQIRTPVQSIGVTSGKHLSDSELARRIANFYGWPLDEEGRFRGPDGKPVGGDIAQAAAAMRELEWFYDPLKEGVGIQWGIMPSPYDDGPQQAAGQIRTLLSKDGMYWAYDASGRPAIRMRDGKTADQIKDEFRTDPAYLKYRKETR